MSGAKATMFFRPWSATESNNNTNSITISEHLKEKSSTLVLKKEEDTDSVVSVSSVGDSSETCSSENEYSTQGVTTRRLRRRSESSGEESSRSWSVQDEETAKEGSLEMLNNFVFNSSAMSSPKVVVNKKESATSAFSFLDSNGCSSSTAQSLDYLQRMTLHRLHNFNPLMDSSRFMPMNLDPAVLQASTLATTGQPFGYDFSGVHHFPQELYTPSVEHAVEMVHRQDVVAKQMKKLRPKKFRCEHCDVAFSNNGQLKGHIRIHTGERPFKCDAEGCGKSFTRNEELTRHKRIHTGLRPHACVVCGKRFGRKDHLKKHTRTHENRDPYRMQAAALGMFALAPPLPPAPPFPSYIYPM